MATRKCVSWRWKIGSELFENERKKALGKKKSATTKCQKYSNNSNKKIPCIYDFLPNDS